MSIQCLKAGVVTYQSDVKHLRRMFESFYRAVSIAAQSRSLAVVLCVAVNDESSSDQQVVVDLVESVSAMCPACCEVSILSGHGNIGYGAGQNLAIATLEGGFTDGYVLILNPDVVLEEDAIANSLDYLAREKHVAMVVPRGFDLSGGYARLAKRKPSLVVLFLRLMGVTPSDSAVGRLVARYTYAESLPCDEPFSVEYASGCFMFLTARVWLSEGGFDQRFFLYFEDYDLSVRVRAHGEIHELPCVSITHFGGRAGRRGFARLRHFTSSAVQFFRVHGFKLC